MRIRDGVPADLATLLGVWRRAVEATHDFLTAADVDELEGELRSVLPRAAVRVAVGDDRAAGSEEALGSEEVLGFAAGRAGTIDMLFVDPAAHGRGIGTALLDDAAVRHPILTLDVNEQNPAARDFYRRRGFVETGRSDTDDRGRPFPLVHLRRSAPR